MRKFKVGDTVITKFGEPVGEITGRVVKVYTVNTSVLPFRIYDIESNGQTFVVCEPNLKAWGEG